MSVLSAHGSTVKIQMVYTGRATFVSFNPRKKLSTSLVIGKTTRKKEKTDGRV